MSYPSRRRRFVSNDRGFRALNRMSLDFLHSQTTRVCRPVRLQRTRWGSCSNSGTVSLNAALLFLEPPLVRYLFIHELCHLIALNHSRKFWSAVARYEPDYEALDRRLTAAWSEIPLWAHGRTS